MKQYNSRARVALTRRLHRWILLRTPFILVAFVQTCPRREEGKGALPWRGGLSEPPARPRCEKEVGSPETQGFLRRNAAQGKGEGQGVCRRRRRRRERHVQPGEDGGPVCGVHRSRLLRCRLSSHPAAGSAGSVGAADAADAAAASALNGGIRSVAPRAAAVSPPGRKSVKFPPAADSEASGATLLAEPSGSAGHSAHAPMRAVSIKGLSFGPQARSNRTHPNTIARARSPRPRPPPTARLPCSNFFGCVRMCSKFFDFVRLVWACSILFD